MASWAQASGFPGTPGCGLRVWGCLLSCPPVWGSLPQPALLAPGSRSLLFTVAHPSANTGLHVVGAEEDG